MASRIKKLLGGQKQQLALPEGEEVQTGTFHSIGLQMIREHAAKLGLPEGDNLVLHKDPYKVVREGLRDFRERGRAEGGGRVGNPTRRDVEAAVQDIQRRKVRIALSARTRLAK